MSEKSWLIRTSKKQILGPVSREKVIELIEKSALTEKDEISRGNGYWFHIRERDLLDKYLYGDVPQEFNPISEAPDILTVNLGGREGTGTIDRIPGLAKAKAQAAAQPVPVAKTATESGPVAIDDETFIPSEDDLEYPDMGGEDSAPLTVEGEDGEELLLPSGDDLDYPDMGEVSGPVAASEAPIPAPTPKAKSAPAPEEVTVVMGDDGEEIHLPTSDDLEYPDMGDTSADVTETRIEVQTSAQESDEGEDLLSMPEDNDLEYPDMVEPEVEATPPAAPVIPEAPAAPVAAPVVSLSRKAAPTSAVAKALEQKKVAAAPAVEVPKAQALPVVEELEEEEEEEDDEAVPELEQVEEEVEFDDDLEDEEEEEDEDEDEDDEDTSTRRTRGGVRIKRTYDAPARNDRYLFALLALVLIVLATGILYYYSKILGKPLPFIDGVFVSTAHAQTNVQTSSSQVETSNLSKKKIFLSSTR